ncbi:MAG: hypothetical protein HGB02_03770 [Chlorobiaceae bacterium]|nr:hypothetical protein [Chlorobiaceae bacterium]
MTQAEKIMEIADLNEAAESACAHAIAENQLWKSETSVFVFDDNSQVAFSGNERWIIETRKDSMLIELMEAKERGVDSVWYGNVENAEPIGIDEAILDIRKIDNDAIGEGDWGEWEEGK